MRILTYLNLYLILSCVHCALYLCCDYGEGCEKQCHQHCVKCERFSGDCVECAPGYSGDYCCPEYCKGRLCNLSNGQCDECVTGFYGQYCDMKCPVHCLNNTCLSTGVCLACENGYYGRFCDSICPKHCLRCQRHTGHCELCKLGYFGSNCDVCSEYCYGGRCSVINGSCTDGCTNGFYGTRCSNNCSSTCQNSVCFQDTGDCSSCEVGKFGRLCQFDCPENCVKKVCHQATCVCLSGCINEKYGDHCNFSCSSICQDYLCKQENGKCILGCFNNLTDGSFCNLPCPKTCNKSKCSSNGRCFNFSAGFYGELCNDSCLFGCRKKLTVKEICDVQTVTCSHGCVNGFYGQICDKRCEDACINKSCDYDATECLLLFISESESRVDAENIECKGNKMVLVYGMFTASVFVFILSALLCVWTVHVRRTSNRTKLTTASGISNGSIHK